jgi:hypothetical protein
VKQTAPSETVVLYVESKLGDFKITIYASGSTLTLSNPGVHGVITNLTDDDSQV